MSFVGKITAIAVGGVALFVAGAVITDRRSDDVATAQEARLTQEPISYIGNGAFLSSGVRVGNTIYLSGQLGLSGERGITPETRGTMDAIKALLEANGSHMDDVVKCTVYLADMAEWSAMNDVYVTYFTKHRPARSAVAVSGIAADARVEIECMAVLGARNAS